MQKKYFSQQTVGTTAPKLLYLKSARKVHPWTRRNNQKISSIHQIYSKALHFFSLGPQSLIREKKRSWNYFQAYSYNKAHTCRLISTSSIQWYMSGPYSRLDVKNECLNMLALGANLEKRKFIQRNSRYAHRRDVILTYSDS